MNTKIIMLIAVTAVIGCRKPETPEKLIFRDGFALNKDTVAPLVVSVTGEAGTNQLLVEFNEPVFTDPSGSGNLVAADFSYQDNNATGSAGIASLFEANGGDRIVVLTVNTNIVAGDSGDRVIFPADAIFDAAGNALAATDRAILISAVPPTLIGAETMDADRNGKIDHLKLTFNKNLNDSTFPNYVNTGAVGGITGAWMVTAFTNVRIDPTVAADIDNDNIIYIRWDESGAEDTAFVPNLTTSAAPGLQGANGATLNQISSSTIDETDGAPPVLLDATEKGGENELVLSFSEPVYTNNTGSGNLMLSDFTYTNSNPSGATAFSVLTEADGSDKVITIQMNSLFVMGDGLTDRIAVNANQVFDGSALAAVNCLTGTHCQGTYITARITSGDAPTLVSAETMDMDGNGKIDHYKLTFNVPVSDASFPGFAGNNALGAVTAHWFVGTYTNVRIDTRDAVPPAGPGDTGTNDAVIYLAFDEKTAACSGNDISGCDSGALPEVTTTATPGLTDLDPTTMAQLAIGGVSESDKALPRLITLKGSGGSNSLFVCFSEAVFTNSGGTGNLAIADFTYQNDNAGGATAIASLSEADGADGKVTITTTGNFAIADDNTDDLVIPAASVYDLGGNAIAAMTPIRVTPLLLSAETVDINGDGVLDHYKLTYASAVADSTFPGYGGTNAEGTATSHWQVALNTNIRIDTTNGRFTPDDVDDDNIIYLAFDGGSDTGERPELTTSATPGLALAGGLSDGLQITPAGLNEQDKAPPKILSIFTTSISSNIVEILFSEPVYTNTGASGNLVTGDFTYGNVNAGGAASISSMNEANGSDRKVRLTLNANVTFQDSTRDTLTPTSIYDAADNLAPAVATPLRAFPRVIANNAVNASLESGGILYIGGAFTSVGYYSGSGLMLNHPNAAQSLSHVTGNVNVAISDGSGGFYLGGDFTHVGGVPRSRLARIKSDGVLHPWNPGSDGLVTALALSGTTLYVGGDFANTGGQARNRLAAIDTLSGQAMAWNPNANGNIAVLQVSGGILYAGGAFTTLNGGTPRNRLAAFDTATGNLTAWNPNANTGSVYTIVVSGSVIYLGGDFTTISSTARQHIAAVDTAGTLLNTFIPSADDTVRTMVLNGSSLYVGGDFGNINGSARLRVAELNTGSPSGAPTNWRPDVAGGDIYSMALSGNALYITGSFDTINTSNTRNAIASLDITNDGTSGGINPGVNATAYTVALSGSNVFFGGVFKTTGSVTRNRLAAINLSANTIESWDPNVSSTSANIKAMALDGSTLFVGGKFTTIGGNSYSNAARVSLAGGTSSACSNPDNDVEAIAVSGSTLYLGGSFDTVSSGSTTRRGLAAFTTSVCTVNATWNPSTAATNFINAIVATGSAIYVGGSFTNIGGTARNRIAALDPTGAGTALTWNPGADNVVSALWLDGTTMYVGGSFANIGGQARSFIAALDTASNSATAWNPGANNSIQVFRLSGTTLYAGGAFTNIGGQARNYLAALDTTVNSNNATAWAPSPGAAVNAIAIYGTTVHAGGAFSTFGTTGIRGLAAVDATTGNVIEY